MSWIKGYPVGTRVLICGAHVWTGYVGEVADHHVPPGTSLLGPALIVRLEAGHRSAVTNPEHVRIASQL